MNYLCTECETPLNDEELQSPHTNDQGLVLCDQCHTELYMDTCSRCQNIVANTELESRPGEVIVIYRTAPSDNDSLEPGYYRVKAWPFFGGPLVGTTYFYSSSLERLSDLDETARQAMDYTWHLSGPICEACQNTVMGS